MNETERVEEWTDHFKSCRLKMNALSAVLQNDGERMLQQVMKRLGLGSALDVVKACKDDWKK